MDIRNVAIIAHVDHGKTTLVDGLLKQSKTFRANEAAMQQNLIMDSNDLERERGITILAKNTAVIYNDTKINIIDTPGHSDFGGEVERTLNMADGALLIIDAQEGPMPQTKFVLKKALELGLKLIVIVNKIDKKDAQPSVVVNDTQTLFLDLATEPDQLDFPTYYAVGRDGKAWDHLPYDPTASADLTPVFEAIMEYIPAPAVNTGPLQMLITSLDQDSFQGKYAIGRITRGEATAGANVVVIDKDGTKHVTRINKVFISEGLKRVETQAAVTGDIAALTGLEPINIGDTVADRSTPEALPRISVAEPTLQMAVSINTSPFAGQEGQYVTSRQLLNRINRELETNVSLRMKPGDGGTYILSGRGELHLAIFIETLRREGFELQIGKPHVITHKENGVEVEPIEEVTVDVAAENLGPVTSEVGRRRGTLLSQSENGDGTARLVFKITTRGLLGLRNQLLTISRGTATMHSQVIGYEPVGTTIPKLRNGVLVASHAGKAVSYGLHAAQLRGATFIPPQTPVYVGMIVGLNSRDDDLNVNVTKEKKLTNMRSSGADDQIILTPPVILSLEHALSFLEEDELLEVTPKNLRLRKQHLNPSDRRKKSK